MLRSRTGKRTPESDRSEGCFIDTEYNEGQHADNECTANIKPSQNNKQKLITRLLINSKLNVRLSVSHDERIKE